MKLYILLSGLSAVLHFQTPGAGRYYLFSRADGAVTVEASNHVDQAAHVSVTVPKDSPHRVFWVQWEAD